MTEPKDAEERKLAHQKIKLSNLWFARQHRFSSGDNLLLDDEHLAIQEALYYKKAGGKTIVDMTCNNIGRNPARLVNVSKATGLNIIMGTSYYHAKSHDPVWKLDSKTEEDLADEFIRDITVAVGDTSIKAGVIGEIGCSWPLEDNERKVLRAAGIAQRKTGAAINIHPGRHQDALFQYVELLKDAGVDLKRVAISHITASLPLSARDTRARLAEKGFYLEYDMFGRDGFWPTSPGAPHDVASDVMRINQIMELIEDGFLDRVLISQDVCFKIMLRSYGGGGYSFILNIIVPKMREKGLTEQQIHTILVDNPQRLFAFA
jgi:phosphotriesterase-related protein